MFRSINKSKGFVLLFVLFFMQLIALMSWYTLQNVLLENKMSHHFLLKHQMGNAAKAALRQAEAALAGQCKTERVVDSLLLSKPLDWWQSFVNCSGTIFSGNRFYYVVESLGADPCASVDFDNMADYYRVTLRFEYEKEQITLFLQSVVVRAIKKNSVCSGTLHSVKTGRQSWREIVNES